MDIDLTDAQKRLASLPRSPYVTVIEQFVAGNHWQGGMQWIGPRPGRDDDHAAQVMQEIERTFVARNVIGEVIDRHVNGVVGRPVAWRLVGNGNVDDVVVHEAEQALTRWWDYYELDFFLSQFVRRLLIQQRVPLRVILPSADARVWTSGLEDVMHHVRVEMVDLALCGVIKDGLIRYGLLTDGQYSEMSWLDRGDTVLRIRDGSMETEQRLPLDGMLLHYDAIRDPFVTETLIRQQRLLNLACTMLSRNVVMGGFLERVLLNAQLPGRWETTPDGRRRFVPEMLRFGAGSVTVLQGAEIRDERTDELKGFATPNVVYRDPVPVETFDQTIAITYRAMLSEVSQLHALLAGDAVASGIARQQAMHDFAGSLRTTAHVVESMVRWMLRVVLAVAAYYSGVTERYRLLRPVVMCHLHTGQQMVTPETLVRLVDSRIMSRETAMTWLGIHDPDGEWDRIQREQQQASTLSQQMLAAFDSGL